MKIGIVALSFGKVREPAIDTVNHALSILVRNAHDEVVTWRLTLKGDNRHTRATETVIVAQQEIARYLHENDLQNPNIKVVTDAHATRKGSGRFYLDTQDVLNEAFKTFKKENVREVIVVAHPFLHAWMARRYVKQAGFINHEFRGSRWIGFDSSQDNLQWWCRGSVRFLLYIAIQVAGKVIGKDFHGIGERNNTSA